jgi:hypothetical protein
MRPTKLRSSWLGTGESFIPGSVCWIDVSSTEPAGSRDFYTGLFGWTYPIDPGRGHHATALCTGWPVAGLAGVAVQAGQLVTWIVYLTSASITHTAAVFTQGPENPGRIPAIVATRGLMLAKRSRV